MTETIEKSLSEANYRTQPRLPCCRNCRYSRGEGVLWENLCCTITPNGAGVGSADICDRYAHWHLPGEKQGGLMNMSYRPESEDLDPGVELL